MKENEEIIKRLEAIGWNTFVIIILLMVTLVLLGIK